MYFNFLTTVFSQLLQYLPCYQLCKIFLKIINLVKMFPWKIYICTTKVSVSSCLFVNRSSQVKHLNDSSRTKVKVLTNNLNQFCIRKFACSKCFYVDRCRMSNTDCIGKLNLTFICKTCCNDILCNITCSICCRTVNLCAVFSTRSR